MKKSFFCLLAGIAAVAATYSCKSTAKAEDEVAVDEPNYELVTYVWNGGELMPDPNLQTTINYAFANINDTRDGVIINNLPRFQSIIDLKKVNPDLKVLLSIGGDCASGFSEMAADSLKRAALAGDCKRIIDEYGIDGIDFDWEFPGWEGGSPDDAANFSLVLKAVRDSIGPDKLLTLAGGGDLPGVVVPDVIDLLDYFNIMAYDLGGQAPWHHTALYRSPNTGWRSVDEVVEYYRSLDIPYDKMVLGLAFYGRGDDNYYSGWTSYFDCLPKEGLTVEWDSIACVPYIADADGALVLGYDDPRSLEIKCDYIKEKGLRGGMCWRTELDTDSLTLAHSVAKYLLNK